MINDGESKGKISLQKRSTTNKTFPFLCQATWSGKVEHGEELEETIIRECKEELGDDFCNALDISKLNFIEENDIAVGEENWECYNYLGEINGDLIKLVKMHDGAFKDLILAGKDTEFYPLKDGKNPENNIVLFDDQYKILKDILK